MLDKHKPYQPKQASLVQNLLKFVKVFTSQAGHAKIMPMGLAREMHIRTLGSPVVESPWEFFGKMDHKMGKRYCYMPYKKGQSGNLKGRPKRVKPGKTVTPQVLEAAKRLKRLNSWRELFN